MSFTSGTIKSSLGSNVLGVAKGPNRMIVKNTGNIEDILSYMVHEGQHIIDLRKEFIPLANVSQSERLFAEMRAFNAQGEFAAANRFYGSKSIQWANKSVQNGRIIDEIHLAGSVNAGYNLGLSSLQEDKVIAKYFEYIGK